MLDLLPHGATLESLAHEDAATLRQALSIEEGDDL